MIFGKKLNFKRTITDGYVDFIYPKAEGNVASTAWVDLEPIFMSGWSFEMYAWCDELDYNITRTDDYVLFAASSSGTIKWSSGARWFGVSSLRSTSTVDYRSPQIHNGGKVHVANSVQSTYSSFAGKGWCIMKSPKLTGQTSSITITVNNQNVNCVLDYGPSSGSGFPNIGVSLFAIRKEDGSHSGKSNFLSESPMYKINYLKYFNANNVLQNYFRAYVKDNISGMIDDVTGIFYPGNQNVFNGSFDD